MLGGAGSGAMCLILIALDSHPDLWLILAANRDEFYDRPSAVAGFWTDAAGILGGRDLKAGGSWLGIDRRGRIAAVTNYRQGQRETTAPRSRGHLVSDYLRSRTEAVAYLEQVQRDAARYNGFNLIVGDTSGLRYFSNREGRPRRLDPGVYGLSNHLLDTAWPKVTSGKSALHALLAADASELIPNLFALLSDRKQAADPLLPRTGVTEDWERLLSSAFIASGEYGTRSSTVVLVSREGGVVFVERSFGPNGASAEEIRYQFELAS
jgi:uncharacterized protein with NRDE domain